MERCGRCAPINIGKGFHFPFSLYVQLEANKRRIRVFYYPVLKAQRHDTILDRIVNNNFKSDMTNHPNKNRSEFNWLQVLGLFAYLESEKISQLFSLIIWDSNSNIF